jgi:hypothetical protein
MKTIETTIIVQPDGSITIRPRPELAPGEHRAVLVIEETLATVSTTTKREPLNLPVIDVGSLHREDIYDDWGR